MGSWVETALKAGARKTMEIVVLDISFRSPKKSDPVFSRDNLLDPSPTEKSVADFADYADLEHAKCKT
jgi:hypothetical protein